MGKRTNTDNMNKTAAAYIRVSTNDQTEYSPDAQLKAIKAYCKNNGYTLNANHIYIEEGKSGRKAEKRPEFMKMIGAAKSKPAPFDVILVHKFDRFARNRTDSVVYKSLLQKECNVKVISITETIENDKFSIIMESMLEAMAEYYSINLSEEVKKGMTEKATRGEPLTIAPFGYKMQNKQLVISEEQAEIIRDIFDRFLKGEGYLAIAKHINSLGIKTNRGNKFENRTVEYIIRNPVYCGYIRWNPAERTRRDFTHPDLMIVKGTHEPIIDEITFNKAQQRVSEIKAIWKPYYKPQSKPSHWLVGLAQCPTCGGSMINSGGYFVCSRSIKGTCLTRNSILAGNLEKIILAKIKNDIENHSAESVIISPVNFKLSSNVNDIKTKLENAKIRLSRVKEAYEKGIDSLEEYGYNKSRIQLEIDELTKKLEASQNVSTQNYSHKLTELLSSVYNILISAAPNEEKHAAAEKVIKNIIYNKADKTLKIQYFYTEK